MAASAKILNDWLIKHLQPKFPTLSVQDMLQAREPIPGVLVQFKIHISPVGTEQTATLFVDSKEVARAKFSTVPIVGEGGNITIQTTVVELPQSNCLSQIRDELQSNQEQITNPSSIPEPKEIVSPYLDLFRK